MWLSKKVRLKNRQTGYQRTDPDPTILRRKKIRRFVVGSVTGLVSYAIIVASIDRIVFLFEPEFSAKSAASAQINPLEPTPLMCNAFKLGHGLTQMRYAEANDRKYIKWKNKTIVYLAALGLDISIIHQAFDDGKLTLDETTVLSNQIEEDMKQLHGVKAASTFMLGVDLIPVTQAFESYLADKDYRNQLEKSNVSILQFGSLLDSNIDAADFPDDFKINLITEFKRTYHIEDTQIKLYQIKRFRERILNYFLSS